MEELDTTSRLHGKPRSAGTGINTSAIICSKCILSTSLSFITNLTMENQGEGPQIYGMYPS